LIPEELNYATISKVYKKISPYIIKTPIIKNSINLDKIFNSNTYFKLEFLQNSGCFKVRGAINNILNLSQKQKKNGITAVSAGNHAIASAYAANIFSIKNKIFMYESANEYRINKVKSLNANLYLTNPHKAFNDVEYASSNENYFFIHPFEGKNTLQGTASLGFEITNQIDKIDNIIISVGGGGLIAGIGSIIKQKFPKCKIIGVEPSKSNGMSESLRQKKPLKNVNIKSIADSLSPPLHMPYSFSICQNVIDEMICVSDNEMLDSMIFMYENFKLFLEPACVAGIAALRFVLKDRLKNQNTLVILCGSSIDYKSWLNFTKKIK
tara:strand:+ start:700 stop:1671 length:972 start_codon:yes stop_codon:yes gene_type:complete